MWRKVAVEQVLLPQIRYGDLICTLHFHEEAVEVGILQHPIPDWRGLTPNLLPTISILCVDAWFRSALPCIKRGKLGWENIC